MISEMDFGTVFGPFLGMLAGYAPYFALLLAVILVARTPMPGRGPSRGQGRDPWRGFKYDARKTVLERAGGRCEGAAFIAWGRCSDPAQEVDHVYPWSKSGPTVVSNGQALCKGHNRNKSNMAPPWWYVRTLEKRRLGYYPEGASVRVSAAMSAEDLALRDQWAAKRRGSAG